MRHSNIIELNGKQYDATTGAVIGERLVLATPSSRAAYRSMRQGRSIDGFVRSPAKPEAVPPAKNAAQPQPAGAHKTMPKARTQHHVKPHVPERTHTLMRHVVKKPATSLKPAIRTAPAAGIAPKTAAALSVPLEKKVSVFQVNAVRLAHAKHIHKSHHIQHFIEQTGPSPTPANQPAPVVVQPAILTAQHHVAPVSHSAALERAHMQLASKRTAAELFETALSKATSHEQPKHPHRGKATGRHKKLMNALAGVAAFLVIGGFVTYLNMPAIELNVASMRAGFHAAAPAYQLNGYSLANGIRASKGRVEMTYRSADSSYKITQVASDWNSATLLDQNLEQRGAPTRTVQSKGRIIYIYDNSATWVNGGVVYDVRGDAAFDADELVTLATSM